MSTVQSGQDILRLLCLFDGSRGDILLFSSSKTSFLHFLPFPNIISQNSITAILTPIVIGETESAFAVAAANPQSNRRSYYTRERERDVPREPVESALVDVKPRLENKPDAGGLIVMMTRVTEREKQK
mmetsp:Transcript_18336/g.20884  ORF Transcript_18336/g.20884 Transcript_18336/m.20884 type:complete len:128 (-) Transcript_18336:417-800(-)